MQVKEPDSDRLLKVTPKNFRNISDGQCSRSYRYSDQ